MKLVHESSTSQAPSIMKCHLKNIKRTWVIFRATKYKKGNNSYNIDTNVMDLVHDAFSY